MSPKILITFAAAVGSSKSPIANFLSTNLNLPVLNNDAIRTEVLEDLGFFNEEEYLKRRDNRIQNILKNNLSIIYDASIDREWVNWKDRIAKAGYQTFIISLNFSQEFLTKLYMLKGYHESLQRLEELYNHHQHFLQNYSDEVNLRIAEKDFQNRLPLSLSAVQDWIKAIK